MIDLTELIQALDSDREVRTWLVIRHGAKALAEVGIPFEDIPLSDRGVVESIALGSKLKAAGINISQLCSSPLTRCLQTGRCLLEGHGSTIEIRRQDVLAYPGTFLADGTVSVGPTEGVRNVLKAVTACPSHRRSIGLAITHDAVIAPILTYLIGEVYDPQGKWIDPLDGFVLLEINGSWKAFYQGKAMDVTSLLCAAIAGP